MMANIFHSYPCKNIFIYLFIYFLNFILFLKTVFLLCDFAMSLAKKLESVSPVPNFEFRQTHLGQWHVKIYDT